MKGSAQLAAALSKSARILASVAAGRSAADQQVERQPGAGANDASRAAVLDLTQGTLRRYGRVQALLRLLSSRGSAPDLVEGLLWCSFYALDSGRYADYTVVDQAVKACALLRADKAKGYVNALLRAYLRQRESVQLRLAEDVEAVFQHPRWWIGVLREAYPSQADDILAAGNAHPPMCLRVNRRRISPNSYALKLEAAGIRSRFLGDQALLIEQPVPVERLPGFDAGEVSVQDAGAQRVARCLQLEDGQNVLDACAAPGGKAAHILESVDAKLTALDIDPVRCERITRDLGRLRLQADVACGDCTRPEQWWHGVPFDRILADVPCSASGVARRHPDIKWLRRASDIAMFAARQMAILDALWRLLASGGKLLYVTCSVFPGENEEVVSAFLTRAPRARRVPLPDGGPAQWFPTSEHDGFFYALIEKAA
jgi:16S rRNA (cytosine967-C5)-methyltransferase